MILPKLQIPISIEIFESNLEYFFDEYKISKKIPNLSHEKSDFLYGGHRYKIFYQKAVSTNSSLLPIGEIDVISVHENMIEVNAAIYNFGDSIELLLFFDELYLMIIKKWKVELTHEIYHIYDGPASGIWITLGLKTGYFYLTDVSTEIIERIYDNFNYDIKDEILNTENEFVTPISESKREMVIRKYQSEVNKGLPRISDVDFPADIPKPVAREKIRQRFERIKEIKDKHIHWSQVRVVMEYNLKYKHIDGEIQVWDLQYAYKKMGGNWKNVNELK